MFLDLSFVGIVDPSPEWQSSVSPRSGSRASLLLLLGGRRNVLTPELEWITFSDWDDRSSAKNPVSRRGDFRTSRGVRLVSEFDFGVDVDFGTLVLGTMPYDLVPLDAIVRRDRQEQQDLCILLLLLLVIPGIASGIDVKPKCGMDMLGGGPFLSQEIFKTSSRADLEREIT